MTKPAPTYDLMLLLDPTVEPDQRKKILSDTQDTIKGAGEIVASHDYGMRPTTYEVRKRTEAEYDLIQFHGNAELLSRLDRTLRITDGVLRFRIIKLAPGTPTAPNLKASAAPAVEAPSEDADDRDSEPAPAA